MLLGVDIGGTFTDFVLLDDDGRLRVHKRPTSSADPAISLLEGVRELELDAAAEVIHGSTIATNALLERRGARTAIVATQGFADVIEIGRQNRPDLYALVPAKPPPLVPRRWRYELRERVTADGEILVPLDPQAVASLVGQLAAEGIESVAVCFLFSFLRPEHERLVRDKLEAANDERARAGAPRIHVSISSDELPEYREYERVSTTAINAYVAPLIDRYLERLEAGLEGRALRVMQSNGGTISADTARRHAARLALSGPAGGVVGALEVARQALTARTAAGVEPESLDVITLDMGGTSTDVSLCPGAIPLTSEGEIGAMPLRLPMIDVHTIGAGGGSLVTVDAGGALIVGPESAGAEPGPVCYGRGGTTPTVTDANLVLGRLVPERFLGGRMALDERAACDALNKLAGQISAASAAEAAWGVLQVANASLERAIRKTSIERGYDPRLFTLLAFGGAGPLHACKLAERMGIARVLVPRAPGVLSALGMIIAERVKDYSLTALRPAAEMTVAQLTALFAPLDDRARAEMVGEGVPVAALQRSIDTRYKGQSFEIAVPIGEWSADDRDAVIPHWLETFHQMHFRRHGHAHPDEPVELVTLRVRAVGETLKPKFEELPKRGHSRPAPTAGEGRLWMEVDSRLKMIDAKLYERDGLMAGDVLSGPALILQLDATTVVPPRWSGHVDQFGHLLLTQQPPLEA